MTAALEDIKIIDIEEWLTLATAPSPTKLKQGQTPNAQNVWVDEKPGSVITAPGYIQVGAIPSGNPVTFCMNYFKSSAGTQTFIVSDNSTVWATTDFQTFTAIYAGLSGNFQMRGLVVRDNVWLTNGSDSVVIYNGTISYPLDGSAGTPNVPKGRYIAYHDERVWIYHTSTNRSKVSFSALTDSSGTIIAPDNAAAWPASNTLQIAEGDADFGTGMILYRGYLHFFKQYSIWRLVGYDEYTYTRVKTRASSGCRFNESLGILDSLVHFIGIDGIYVFDGEETERISDIIDPATATQTAFGFNQLQQPNINNQFWEVASTSDWNAGTVQRNLSVSNALTLLPSDDTQGDFNAGTKTNVDVDTNPGELQLALVTSGGSSTNISQGKSASLVSSDNNTPRYGNSGQITDGDLVNNVGFNNNQPNEIMTWVVDLGSALVVGQATIKGFYAEASRVITHGNTVSITLFRVDYSSDNTNWTTAVNLTPNGTIQAPGIFNSGTFNVIAAADYVASFNTVTARYWRFLVQSNPGSYIITELQIFQAGFKPTGNFISQTLDLGIAPTSFGQLNASYALNGTGTLAFFTQSSDDNISWDARVAVTPGNSITSTLRRYLRWQADFTNGNSGSTSPTIDAVYLPALYLSAIHNTGGSIYAWGPIESDRTLPLQVNYYWRTGVSSAAVLASSWNLIVPGAVISSSVTLQYIQFKIEVLNGDSTHLPVISNVTINWVKGTVLQFQTLQNVASYVWRNRYWIAAAGPGATANNTILVRGKKTFGSPWQLKDFPFLSFTRFQDSLYAGSSQNGSIFQVDTGHSKNGVAIDSFFQTGDFTFGGFYINPIEILVEVERKGPYNLTVGFSIDRGNTWTDMNVDLTLSSFAPSYTKKLNIDTVNTDRIRFRVRTNAIDEPFEAHRLIFYYKLEAARGSIK